MRGDKSSWLQSHVHAPSADETDVCWRPWPCESCSGGTTVISHLGRSFGASGEITSFPSEEIIDSSIRAQAAALIEWVDSCPHTQWHRLLLPVLDEGSEHRVYLEPARGEVFKLTLNGTFGDYYRILDGRMRQERCTPIQYLARLRLWNEIFGMALLPVGISSSAQIVSRQPFVTGEDPEQSDVDDFLSDLGFEPVRRQFWLWKIPDPAGDGEIWLGDARSDNFKMTGNGIVPIDLRMWRFADKS